MEISFLGAWSAWLDGEDISQRTLWGMRILWWGRFGALVQFASALIVIVDLVGAERLRTFGLRLHGGVGTDAARRRLFRGRRWLALYRKYWRAPSDSAEEKAALNRAAESPYNRFLGCGALIAVVLILWWALPNLWLAAGMLVAWFFAIALIGPTATWTVAVCTNMIGVAIDRMLVLPFADFMARPDRAHVLTIEGLLALLLGTAMSMPAS